MKVHLNVVLFAFIYLKCCLAILEQNENLHCSYSQLALSANDFGFELTKQIGGQGNLFISPLSIYTALALMYLGAGGRTAMQIESTFQLKNVGLDSGKLHEAFRNFLNVIKSGNGEYNLLLANGLFVQQDFSLNTRYIEDVGKFYDAAVKEVDFVFGREETKMEINDWVAEKTSNKIKNFLKEPLDPHNILVILNAVYFKGIWKTPFNPEYTMDGTFFKNNGETKHVKYMYHLEMEFRYGVDSNTNYQFLELPYKGEHISMLLVLPPEDIEPDLEMNSSMLCHINNSMSKTKLELVQIPKFKMEYKKSLPYFLKRLGITKLFKSSANLTGIREEGDLKVSEVQHVAVIEVNEEGSEAAASTAISVSRSLSHHPRFMANHPFLLYIIDNRNGQVLFSGRVSDP